jgi:hypothetical protein
MLSAYELDQDIRVLRSSKLPTNNPYRPECGIRYDGLYRITGSEELNGAHATHRFTLERRPGQTPIRYRSDDPGRRPTDREIEKFLSTP